MRRRMVVGLAIVVAGLVSWGVSASVAEATAVRAALSRPTLPTAIPRDSAARSACSQSSTVGIESCQVRETRLLNRQFDLDTELLWTLLGREGRLELVSAQRTWLGYERQECEGLRHAFFGGPIAPVIAGACVITLTQARDQELAQEVSDTIHADCKGVARGGLYRHCPSSSGSHVGIGKG